MALRSPVLAAGALGVALSVFALCFGAPSGASAQRTRAPAGATRGHHDGAVSSGTAPTADVEARRLFDIGAEAFAGARYEEALDHFEASYRLSQRPQLLYNIGLAQDRLRRDALAIESFERFLAEVPDTTKRVEVEGRVAAIREATQRQEQQDVVARAEQERRVREASRQHGSVFSSQWFWVVVGVVVAGACAATAVAVATHDPGVQDPIPGTSGVVVMALDGF